MPYEQRFGKPIRQRLRCQQLHTNLADVVIKYRRNDVESIANEQADLLNDDWNTVKSIVHDELNDEFDFESEEVDRSVCLNVRTRSRDSCKTHKSLQWIYSQ
jgi:hypothetical protein